VGSGITRLPLSKDKQCPSAYFLRANPSCFSLLGAVIEKAPLARIEFALALAYNWFRSTSPGPTVVAPSTHIANLLNTHNPLHSLLPIPSHGGLEYPILSLFRDASCYLSVYELPRYFDNCAQPAAIRACMRADHVSKRNRHEDQRKNYRHNRLTRRHDWTVSFPKDRTRFCR